MDLVITLDRLDIRDELKDILVENGIYSVEGFIEGATAVFKEHYELTFEDWESILNAFISLKAVKKITDTVIAAAVKKPDPRKRSPRNALIVNVFDERYVVSTIKKGKWVFEDLIYKALARGVVFTKEEDAERFADMICKTQGSRKYVKTIQSACHDIHVIHACSLAKQQSIILYGTSYSSSLVLQSLAEEDSHLVPTRAHWRALKAVERINRIYDYEIASLVTLSCDEEKGSVEEVDPREICPIEQAEEEHVYVRQYRMALDSLVDREGDDPFVWGRNAAIELSKRKSAGAIQGRIQACTEELEACVGDAGMTEEDRAYLQGSIEGFKLALSTQERFRSDRYEARIALIDPFGLIGAGTEETVKVISSFTEGDRTVHLKLFATAEDVYDSVDEMQGCYILYGRTLSQEEMSTMCQIKFRFLEKTGRYLLSLSVSGNLKKTILEDLFLLKNGAQDEVDS